MRVKIDIILPQKNANDEHIVFFIDDFPGRLQKDDLIQLDDMFNEDDFNEEELDVLLSGCLAVDFVVWEKDIKGIYLKAFCTNN